MSRRIFATHRITTVPDWTPWNETPPEPGQKIVIVCDDGCSSSLALMTEDVPIDGECGDPIIAPFLDGAIWLPLPSDYPLGFMEITEDDWR